MTTTSKSTRRRRRFLIALLAIIGLPIILFVILGVIRPGQKARVSYVNPTAPSQDYDIFTVEGDLLDIYVKLPSGNRVSTPFDGPPANPRGGIIRSAVAPSAAKITSGARPNQRPSGAKRSTQIGSPHAV